VRYLWCGWGGGALFDEKLEVYKARDSVAYKFPVERFHFVQVVAGSVAAEDGKIEIGDVIMHINSELVLHPPPR
jgi:hypothetical protein